jgi:hypothetical protein
MLIARNQFLKRGFEMTPVEIREIEATDIATFNEQYNRVKELAENQSELQNQVDAINEKADEIGGQFPVNPYPQIKIAAPPKGLKGYRVSRDLKIAAVFGALLSKNGKNEFDKVSVSKLAEEVIIDYLEEAKDGYEEKSFSMSAFNSGWDFLANGINDNELKVGGIIERVTDLKDEDGKMITHNVKFKLKPSWGKLLQEVKKFMTKDFDSSILEGIKVANS